MINFSVCSFDEAAFEIPASFIPPGCCCCQVHLAQSPRMDIASPHFEGEGHAENMFLHTGTPVF